MEYESIRPLLQSGDIVAFTHTGWRTWSDIESQIVRMVTRSEFSHVGILWRAYDRLFVLEAVVPEVRIFPLSKLKEFYWVSLLRPLKEEALEYAFSRVGERYSKIEAIRGLFGSNRSDKSWQCAEFVNAVLKMNDIVLPGRDTPTDLIRGVMEKYSGKLDLITNGRA